VELGVEFLQGVPQMLVIVMTGTILPPEEEALFEQMDKERLTGDQRAVRIDEFFRAKRRKKSVVTD